MQDSDSELFSESTTLNETFGSHFSADVVRRNGQMILLIREKLSQFTLTGLIPNETADSLREELFSKVLELIPNSGATIQVDNAPGFQLLKKESEMPGSILYKFHIKIDLGRTLNANKNPIAENGIKEFHKECLRLRPTGGPLSKTDLVTITKTMNERIRNRGFSAKEMLLQRDQTSNINRPISDQFLATTQYKKRTSKHPTNVKDNNTSYCIGQNVLLKTGRNKLKGRDLYKITKLYNKEGETWATIQKTEDQFRSKEYEVKTAELLPIQDNDQWKVFDSIETSETYESDSDLPTKVLNEEQRENVNTKKYEKKKKHAMKPENEDADSTESQRRGDPTDDATAETIGDDHNQQYSMKDAKKTRKAAARARIKIKELATCSVIRLKGTTKQAPSHAWNWQNYAQMADEDELIYSRRGQRIPSPPQESLNDFVVEEELQWDNSPEQFATSYNTRNSPELPQSNEQIQDCSTNTDSPLTDLPSDSDEVFTNPMSKTRSFHLRRSHAFRRRRPRTSKSPQEDYDYDTNSSNEDASPTLNPPGHIHPHSQPQTVADVQLGPRVQNLEEPLRAVQPALLTTTPPRRIRSSREPLDYRLLHHFGVRRPRM